MSGRTIRTGSGEGVNPSTTDWAKVKALGDAEIDAAISADPDAYPLDRETLGRAGSAYQYVVFKVAERRFRWRLVGANGLSLASSEQDFPTAEAARGAIADLRRAVIGGTLLAA